MLFRSFYIIFFCLLVQLFIIFYAKFNNLIYKGKIHFINYDLIINYIYNVIFKSIFGMQSKIIISYFNFKPIYYLFIIIFTLIAFSYFLLNRYKNYFNNNIFLSISLIYSFFAISLFVMIGGVSNYVGGRYAVIPSIVFLLIFMHLSNLFYTSKIKYLFTTVIVTSI